LRHSGGRIQHCNIANPKLISIDSAFPEDNGNNDTLAIPLRILYGGYIGWSTYHRDEIV
jgi:hypothetical protein